MKQTRKRIIVKMLCYLTIFIAVWFVKGGRFSNWQPYAFFVSIGMVLLLLVELYWPTQKKL